MYFIPCKDCVAFAICNSIVKKYEGVYKTQYIISHLRSHCPIFTSWAGKGFSFTSVCRDLAEFTNLFKIKLDIEPDLYLERHLSIYCGENDD